MFKIANNVKIVDRQYQPGHNAPVTVSDVCNHLGFFGNTDTTLNNQLAVILDAAYQRVSDHIGKPLLGWTVEEYFDDLPNGGVMVLSNEDAVNISIEYYDSDHHRQSIDDNDFIVDETGGETSVIYIGSGIESVSAHIQNPYVVSYHREYAFVDDQIKYAILLICGILFNNKGDEEKAYGERAEQSVYNLLQSHRGSIV